MLDRKHFVFLGGALATLILLLASLISTRESKIDLENEAETRRALEGLAIAVEASPAPERDLVVSPENREWNVEIHASGAIVNSDGVLRFPFGNDNGVQSVSVLNGRCFVDEDIWNPWFASNSPVWFMAMNGFPSRITDSNIFESEVNGRVLVLELGESKEVYVEVTNLRGEPISNAKLQVYGALDPTQPQQACSDVGLWHGKVFGEGSVRLIARADGYGNMSKTISLKEAGPIAVTISLGRFLAMGRVTDGREEYLVQGNGVGLGQFSIKPNSPDYSTRLDKIEEAANLDSLYERVSWTIIQEREWIEGSYIFTRSHPSGLVPSETVEVELKHILDPSLKPFKFPGHWPKEFVPVIIQFQPSSKFSSGATPKSMKLHWEGKGETSISGEFLGLRKDIEERKYLFFVPPGIYDISTSTDPWDTKFGKTPVIEKISDYQALGGVLPPQIAVATLGEDCFFSGYIIEDDSGLQLEMAGILTEIHGIPETSSSFMAPMFSWPLFRFFSGAQCQLWLSSYGRWPERVGSPFLVNQPKAGEILHIRVPSEGLEKTLSQ